MGFISSNENHCRRKQEEYENKILSDAELCEAKLLRKVLDDLTDEEICIYCEWIGYEEDTSNVFLMRDALLLYMYSFRQRNRQYPSVAEQPPFSGRYYRNRKRG